MDGDDDEELDGTLLHDASMVSLMPGGTASPSPIRAPPPSALRGGGTAHDRMHGGSMSLAVSPVSSAGGGVGGQHNRGGSADFSIGATQSFDGTGGNLDSTFATTGSGGVSSSGWGTGTTAAGSEGNGRGGSAAGGGRRRGKTSGRRGVDGDTESWVVDGVQGVPRHVIFSDYQQLKPAPAVDMSMWEPTDTDLAVLGQESGSHLLSLNLNRCRRITDRGIAHLDECRSLTSINLAHTRISDEALTMLRMTHGHLTEVDLTGCHKVTENGVRALMTGCLRMKVFRLASMKQLTDSALQFVGERPKKQSRITTLDVSHSALATDSGVLALLQGAQGIVQVDLSGNPALTDIVLSAFSDRGTAFASLTSIDLTNMQVADSGAGWLAAGCVNLKSIILDGCGEVSDLGVTAMADLRQLQKLSVARCTQITDVGLSWLAEGIISSAAALPARPATHHGGSPAGSAAAEGSPGSHRGDGRPSTGPAAVTVTPNKESKEGTPELLSPKSPKSPKLSESPTSPASPSSPSSPTAAPPASEGDGEGGAASSAYSYQRPGLTDLDITDCGKVTDAGITAIASACGGLKRLVTVGVNRLTDASLRALAGARCRDTLTELNLSGRFQVTNVGLAQYYGVPRIGSAGIQALARHCTRLENLNFAGLSHINDIAIAALAQSCPALRVLNISGCEQVTERSLAVLGASCDRLERLNVSGIQRLQDDAFFTMGPSLRELNLFKCGAITDEGVVSLAMRCPGLDNINLRGCGEVTDAGVAAIAEHCATLQSLNLNSLKELSGFSLDALATGCTRLNTLNVGGCDFIDRDSLVNLANTLPFGRLAGVGFVGILPIEQHESRQERYEWILQQRSEMGAASYIQRLFRGWRSRGATIKYALKRQREEALKRFYRREEYGLVVQRVFRGHLGRLKFKAEKRRQFEVAKAMEAAARLVQRVWRGKTGRDDYIRQRDDMRAFIARCNAAAVEIQRIVRGHQAKQYVNAWRIAANKAALMLEQAYRNGRAKRLLGLKKRMMKQRNEAQRVGATQLQRLVRAWSDSRYVVWYRHVANTAAVAMQRAVRGHLRRRYAATFRRELTWAAGVVQRSFRCHGSRMQLAIRKDKRAKAASRERDAATLVQGVFRRMRWGHLVSDVKRLQRRMNRAATMLQAVFRGRQTRRNLKLQRQLQQVADAHAAERWREVQRAAKVEALRIKERYDMSDVGKRRRGMMQHGAATMIQRLFRTILIRRKTALLVQWRYHQMSIRIERVYRGHFGRVYAHWLRETYTDAAGVVQRAFRGYQGRQRHRLFIRVVEANWIAEQSKKKAEYFRLQWQKKFEKMRLRVEERAACLVQRRFRDRRATRMAAAAAAREKEVSELRAKRRAEEKRQRELDRKERATLAYKIRMAIATLTDRDKLAALLLPNPKVLKRRIRRFRALWNKEIRAEIEAQELEVSLYSIQNRQKVTVSQQGIIDLHLTCGLEEKEAFEEAQHVRRKAKLDFFVLLNKDLGHYQTKGAPPVKAPLNLFVWFQVGNKRTSHIITGIKFDQTPKGMLQKHLEARARDATSRGIQIVNTAHVPLELHLSRETAGLQITELDVSMCGEMDWEKMEADGMERLKYDLGKFGGDKGTCLWVRKAVPVRGEIGREAEWEVKLGGGSSDMLQHMVDFLAVDALTIQQLRAVFRSMDHDESGTLDLDEFFYFLGVTRSSLFEYIFEFTDCTLEDEVDFGEFVRVVGTMCMFGKDELLRLIFHYGDDDNSGFMDKQEMKTLLDMCVETEPKVVTAGQVARVMNKYQLDKDGRITYDEFRDMNLAYPSLMYPMYKFQHAMTTKILGQAFWESKKAKFMRAREMVKRKRERKRRKMMEELQKADRINAAKRSNEMATDSPAKGGGAKGGGGGETKG